MVPCVNKAGCTKKGTYTKLAITPTFMDFASINSLGTMKASSLERSPVPYFPCARLFIGFIFALCSNIPCLSYFIFTLCSNVWPPMVNPPFFIQPNPHLNAHKMPRDRENPEGVHFTKTPLIDTTNFLLLNFHSLLPFVSTRAIIHLRNPTSYFHSHHWPWMRPNQWWNSLSWEFHPTTYTSPINFPP